MTEQEINILLEKQREFYRSGATLPIENRILYLKKLYTAIKENQSEIEQALAADLGKSSYESFMCEIGLTLSEITFILKHIKKYARGNKVPTPLAQFASRSYTYPVPYGNVLIMSPWNYPFLLTIEPLTDAIAAGNTAILKPSAYSPATSAIIEKIVKQVFPLEYVATVTGSRKENQALLEQKFDFIFFTGSQSVGKQVLAHAAPNLTPVLLELGGKSPCIVDSTADIELAAKRIVFGKFLNCGQTCVAPDYILCQEDIKEKLVNALIKETNSQFGTKPLENKDYGKIINHKHFTRITGLIDKNKVRLGGDSDPQTLKIAPTILDNVNFQDPVMQEEIFGPVLPVLTYKDLDDVIAGLKEKDKPLALYFFSTHKKSIKKIVSQLSYGGGCINDVIIHLATCHMGFGGVGASGMGSYHGKEGFEAFSHRKSIVDKKNWIDLPMRYQPYKSRLYEKLLHYFLK